ncbi:DUF1963 domain-containing protein [Actinoplanes subglobosus]|uniref:DUF1963 domain-containing protein n=1 Tax=Actinoplanes subglobosus TaxID=1547892 RepID=A0ABV8J985_9ACTN
MVTLMTYAGAAAADAPGTRTGGVPLVPAGFEWPVCAECDGPMQFLAQVDLGGGLFSVFMCQNDPGMCDEWDATAGGNRAFVFGAGAVHAATPPGDGVTMLEEVCAVAFAPVDAGGYREATESWSRLTGRPAREVLGHTGTAAQWLQNDETPECGGCGRPMTFVVQLDEGHDHRTAINFGNGYGYGFRCEPCGEAAFLWQC